MFDGHRFPHDGVLVVFDLIERGEHDEGIIDLEFGGGFAAEVACGAGNAGEVLSAFDAAEDFRGGTFAHAVGQDIGLGFDQQTGPHFVLPVIVMGHAAHAGFHAAEHGRDAGESTFAELGIDHRRHRRFQTGFPAGRIHVVRTQTAADGIDADHGIHIAGGDAAGDAGATHDLDRIGIFPVGLCDDADAPAVIEEEPSDQRHAEGRMVHVGVAGDQQYIEFLPAQLIHFRPAHRDKLRFQIHAAPCSPFLNGPVI